MTHTHTYTHSHAHARIHSLSDTQTHTHTRTHTHTHTLPHSRARALSLSLSHTHTPRDTHTHTRVRHFENATRKKTPKKRLPRARGYVRQNCNNLNEEIIEEQTVMRRHTPVWRHITHKTVGASPIRLLAHHHSVSPFQFSFCPSCCCSTRLYIYILNESALVGASHCLLPPLDTWLSVLMR